MAYSKDDFVNFSELDLDLILGDFTESEYDFSGSDFDDCDKLRVSPSIESNTQNVQSKKQYECDECEKTYASISGLRGHLRSKHGKENIRVSQYRKAGPTVVSKPQPFKFERQNFTSTFKEVLPKTLSHVANNKFRQLKRSVSGKGITQLATCALDNKDIQDSLIGAYEPIYYQVFNKAAESDANSNEMLFEEFYSAVLSECSTNVSKCFQNTDVTTESLPIRQFTAVLHRQLIGDLIENRAKLCEPATKATKQLSDSEQSVLFYISGYILNQLNKRLSKNETISKLLKNENDSEKTFVHKYSEWTKTVSRGALKIPSDNFFLFIRECEICVRKNTNESHVHTTTYVQLKELLMEDNMVNYYADKAWSGKQAPNLIEQCIVVFVNVRGPAAARMKKLELLKTSEATKSLRKVLKDKSNCM